MDYKTATTCIKQSSQPTKVDGLLDYHLVAKCYSYKTSKVQSVNDAEKRKQLDGLFSVLPLNWRTQY